MANTFLTCFFLFIFGFSVMYFSMTAIYKSYADNNDKTLLIPPFIYIWCLFTASCIGSYFLIDLSDFLVSINFWRIFIPLCLSLVIYYGSLLFSVKLSSLIILCCVIASVLLQPTENIIYTGIPIWIVQALIILLSSVYCIFSYILNTTSKIYLLPNIITLSGVIILGFIGAAPMYSAVISVALLSILLAIFQYNNNEDKISLDTASCSAIAFLICQILFLQINELSFSSCAIFTSLFWAELLTAIWNKYISFQTGRLDENTNYYQMAQKYSAHIISMTTLRIGMFTLFLGWLQLFSMHNHALIFISFLITVWLNRSTANPTKKKTFKQLNSEFVENLKQNIQETKEILQNSQNKKD